MEDSDRREEIMHKVVAVSGAFDPVHVGHIRYFQEAKKLGDSLMVILNTERVCFHAI